MIIESQGVVVGYLISLFVVYVSKNKTPQKPITTSKIINHGAILYLHFNLLGDTPRFFQTMFVGFGPSSTVVCCDKILIVP